MHSKAERLSPSLSCHDWQDDTPKVCRATSIIAKYGHYSVGSPAQEITRGPFMNALFPSSALGALSRDGARSLRFEGCPLLPRCHIFLIFHGIAETFGLDPELA